MFNRKWFHKYIYIHIHIYIVTPKKIEKSCNTILVGMLLSLLDLYRHLWLSDGSILFYMFGGFKHLLFFSISYMGMSWSQLTNSYFSRWAHCTTNQHRSCTIIHSNLHFSTSFYIFGCYYPTLYGLLKTGGSTAIRWLDGTEWTEFLCTESTPHWFLVQQSHVGPVKSDRYKSLDARRVESSDGPWFMVIQWWFKGYVGWFTEMLFHGDFMVLSWCFHGDFMVI
jgi:hypothetical protein